MLWWTAVNLYSSCKLIVRKLYRFLYFGRKVFFLCNKKISYLGIIFRLSCVTLYFYALVDYSPSKFQVKDGYINLTTYAVVSVRCRLERSSRQTWLTNACPSPGAVNCTLYGEIFRSHPINTLSTTLPHVIQRKSAQCKQNFCVTDALGILNDWCSSIF